MSPVRWAVWSLDGVAARLVRSSKRARADVCCGAGAALVLLSPLTLPEGFVERTAVWGFSLVLCAGIALKYSVTRSRAGRSSEAGGAAVRDPFAARQLVVSEVMLVAFCVLAAAAARDGSLPALQAGLVLVHAAEIVLLRDGEGPGRTVWVELSERISALAGRLSPAPVHA